MGCAGTDLDITLMVYSGYGNDVSGRPCGAGVDECGAEWIRESYGVAFLRGNGVKTLNTTRPFFIRFAPMLQRVHSVVNRFHPENRP